MTKPIKSKQRRPRNRKPTSYGSSAENLTAHQRALSAEECAVLKVFRTYLMTPGRMLCFTNTDLVTMEKPLAELTTKGFLMAENVRGRYSLTSKGFAEMKRETV